MLLDKIVIGSTVKSAAFALSKGYYFINVREQLQPFYDQISEWSRLILELGLSGKLLSYEETPKVRIEDDIIKIATDSHTIKYQFGRCYALDPTRVQHENEFIKTNPKTFLVLDDLELSQMGKRENIPELVTDLDFARRIVFYTSDRVDGASYITDCVVESVLTHEHLNSFDYSDTMVKFVVERYLKSQDINGIFMNLYKNGTPKYRKPIAKHVNRLVFEKDNNVYKDSEAVKFRTQDTIDEFKPEGTPLSRYYTALG
jgi:hypothetical protein